MCTKTDNDASNITVSMIEHDFKNPSVEHNNTLT